jgi:hypothetical protein
MSVFSLYDELTSVPGGNYEATELAKHLINVVGHEVSSFNRHAVHSYGIIQKSQAIYRGINTSIETLDGKTINGETTDSDATNFWDDYETYTNAIDPLEK